MNLLIDIGNVLVRFSYNKLIERVAPGSDASILDDVLALRDRFETGLMDIPEFTSSAKQILNFQDTDAEFQKAWCEIFTPVPEMVELLPIWKAQGHRLILFSNINPLHHPYLFETYPELFSHFEEGVMSYQIGGMKPASAMYEHAVNTLQLVPSETVYLDDLRPNIEKGNSYGFDGIQVDWDKPHTVIQELSLRGL